MKIITLIFDIVIIIVITEEVLRENKEKHCTYILLKSWRGCQRKLPARSRESLSMYTFRCQISESYRLPLLIDYLSNSQRIDLGRQYWPELCLQSYTSQLFVKKARGNQGWKLFLLDPKEYHQECMSNEGWCCHFPLDTMNLWESNQRILLALCERITHKTILFSEDKVNSHLHITAC